MTAICGMISWTAILWTSIRWHKGLKAQGIDRSTLVYRAPLQPYLSYYGLCVAVMVMIFGGFTSFSTFCPPPCARTQYPYSALYSVLCL
jgi:yeast amino acid transporter